ncbi:MAG: hypothetical protein ACPF8V_00760 [Luteibaculum sp.]
MSDLSDLVYRLTKKVDFVLQHAESLKEQLQEKDQQIVSLKDELKHKESEFSSLKEKVRLFESAEAFAGTSEGGKKEARLKINELVREIDKCIALLNR